MPTVTVSEKGQITLPAALRKKLRLRPRSQVDLIETDGGVMIKPVRDIMDLAGIFAEAAKGRSNDWDEIREYTERAVAEEAMRE
jgi:AbrB family looped-hinge helix DNA binding protein